MPARKSPRMGMRRGALAALVAAIASMAMLGAASPAMATLKQDLARFSDCPLENPEATQCVYADTDKGEFVLGNGAVPVSKPVIIQGGLTPPVLVPAAYGNTLSKTPLPVPGGLVGIELIGNFTEVTATAELAGQAEISTEVVLPLKVKLDNPLGLLGGSCYIGSNSEPISLHLKYGSGSSITTKDNGAIKVITGTLIDKTFAAPGANGCTLVPLVGDLAVNVKEGLPSASGKNKAEMGGTTEEVAAQIVKAVKPLPDFGHCAKVVHGGYGNSTCTAETPAKNGKFEWTEGPGPNAKFSGTGTKVTLEGVGHSLVTCTASSNAGEYTGPKSAKLTLKLTGCAAGVKGSEGSCSSSGAAAGEIQTAQLNGALNFIDEGEEPALPTVGIDLTPASGTSLATFECGGKPVTVGGSVIVPISSLDKMATSFKLKAKATAGKQLPEAFEAEPNDTLTFNGEQAGLTSTSTLTNEEALEIKALM